MGFLTNQSTKEGRLITVCKWGSYQEKQQTPNKPPNNPLTDDQQTSNKDLTPKKNDNNDKEIEEGKETNDELAQKISAGFQMFWQAYPRKEHRVKTELLFEKMFRKGEFPKDMIKRVNNFALLCKLDKRPRTMIKTAYNYLEEKLYLDDLEPILKNENKPYNPNQ